MAKTTTRKQKEAEKPISIGASEVKTTKTLEERAEEIRKQAEESGLDDDFYFLTTFNRYLTQIKIAEKLKTTIENSDALIEKEYVKGRMNICIHPAITEYNKTVTAANGTVACLLKILEARRTAGAVESDPLAELIGGK